MNVSLGWLMGGKERDTRHEFTAPGNEQLESRSFFHWDVKTGKTTPIRLIAVRETCVSGVANWGNPWKPPYYRMEGFKGSGGCIGPPLRGEALFSWTAIRLILVVFPVWRLVRRFARNILVQEQFLSIFFLLLRGTKTFRRIKITKRFSKDISDADGKLLKQFEYNFLNSEWNAIVACKDRLKYINDGRNPPSNTVRTLGPCFLGTILQQSTIHWQTSHCYPVELPHSLWCFHKDSHVYPCRRERVHLRGMQWLIWTCQYYCTEIPCPAHRECFLWILSNKSAWL